MSQIQFLYVGDINVKVQNPYLKSQRCLRCAPFSIIFGNYFLYIQLLGLYCLLNMTEHCWTPSKPQRLSSSGYTSQFRRNRRQRKHKTQSPSFPENRLLTFKGASKS